MTHCILVKWNELVADKKAILEQVKLIFDKLTKIDGIHSVKFLENVIDRKNRFDLMILIDMEKNVLPIYDESEPHHEWKEKYGKFVENKAIFDYEE